MAGYALLVGTKRLLGCFGDPTGLGVISEPDQFWRRRHANRRVARPADGDEANKGVSSLPSEAVGEEGRRRIPT
jgi:hypothetical protein